MPDRKPRRMIGRPRAPQMSKPPWQWGAAEFAVGCVGWLLMVALYVLCLVVMVWAVVEYVLPWIIDVVMDAVEQRD